MASSTQPTLSVRYLLFVAQFLGAGFVAGSVVHFGEGITIWDVSVLVLGVLLFTGALVYRETHLSDQSLSRKDVAFLIVSSLFLSLTIGMASGGTQHFVDTPLYASVLIPLGLSLGFVAFAITQRVQFTLRKWGLLLLALLAFGLLLHTALRGLNSVLPESIRHGHGSAHHGSSEPTEREPSRQDTAASGSAHSDDHGH